MLSIGTTYNINSTLYIYDYYLLLVVVVTFRLYKLAESARCVSRAKNKLG